MRQRPPLILPWPDALHRCISRSGAGQRHRGSIGPDSPLTHPPFAIHPARAASAPCPHPAGPCRRRQGHGHGRLALQKAGLLTATIRRKQEAGCARSSVGQSSCLLSRNRPSSPVFQIPLESPPQCLPPLRLIPTHPEKASVSTTSIIREYQIHRRPGQLPFRQHRQPMASRVTAEQSFISRLFEVGIVS
jgi:hypothetical protein